jgi:hypothetical protein
MGGLWISHKIFKGITDDLGITTSGLAAVKESNAQAMQMADQLQHDVVHSDVDVHDKIVATEAAITKAEDIVDKHVASAQAQLCSVTDVQHNTKDCTSWAVRDASVIPPSKIF